MDETAMVSPIALRELTTGSGGGELFGSPNAVTATPRTTMRIARRSGRSRPSAPVRELDVDRSAQRTPKRKELPDGLIDSPACSPPTAWVTAGTPNHCGTQPRRFATASCSSAAAPQEDLVDLFLSRQVCDVLLASPPIKLVNGHHVTESYRSPSAEVSVLKQRQLQRMQQLQFEHPSLNATPQRLAGASKGLREILNANATAVQYTPRPPLKLKRGVSV